MAKKKNYTSPEGKAQYPYLTKPDTKFNPAGDYKIDLLLEVDEEVQELLDLIDAEAEASFTKAVADAKPAVAKKIVKAEAYELETDDDGDETGFVVLKFKMKAHVPASAKMEAFDQKPTLFNGDGTDFDSSVAIYGGSKCKVNFQMIPYYMASSKSAGVSLRLRAVQVKELVSGGGAAQYGFDADEEAIANQQAPAPSEDNDAPKASEF